jgi:Uma2 family endonuclease
MSNIASDIQMPYGEAAKSRQPLLPLTFAEREEMGAILSVPATVEEYIEYLHKCDYKIQYSRGMIWSFIEIDEETDTIMGEAAPIHEQLTGRLTHLIGHLLDEVNSEFNIFGSNIKIYIERPNGSTYYNPDLAITRIEPQFIRHKPKKKTATSLTNPTLIVEVLSKSTEGFDKTLKLGDYQKISSVEQIIFVEPNHTWVSTFIRQSNNSWLNIIFENLTDELPVLDKGKIVVNDIYKNLIRLDFKAMNTV